MGKSFAAGPVFKLLDGANPAPRSRAPRSSAARAWPTPSDARRRLVAPTLSRAYPTVVALLVTQDLILAHWRRTTAGADPGWRSAFDAVLLQG